MAIAVVTLCTMGVVIMVYWHVDISASSSLVSVLKEGPTNPAEFKTAFAVLTFVSLAVAPRWQPFTERPQDSASAYEEAQRECTEGGRVLGESS